MTLKKTPDAERLAAALDLIWHEDSGARVNLEEALTVLRRLQAEVEALRRGEFICGKCGLRKDSDAAGPAPF